MNKSKTGDKDDVDYQNFLREISARLREVNEISKQYGIFLNDREIVHCAQCGLTEDIAFSGKLFTYYANDPEFKETGLQFIELENNSEYLQCPICNLNILIPQERE